VALGMILDCWCGAGDMDLESGFGLLGWGCGGGWRWCGEGRGRWLGRRGGRLEFSAAVVDDNVVVWVLGR